jgi:hypothetical protein
MIQKPLEPLPYESLSKFNRRVETALRPDIDIAIKASKAANKKATAKKPKPVDPSLVADSVTASTSSATKSSKIAIDPLVPLAKFKNTMKEFAPLNQTKNILDIAMAPPALKKQRQVTVGATTDPLPSHRLPVSESIKRAMEIEREKAVVNYRLLKEKREKEQRAEQVKL